MFHGAVRKLKQVTGARYKELATQNGLVVSVAAFLACFVLAFVVGSFAIQPQTSKAVTGLGLAGVDTMTLASNTNNINMAITPTSAGALSSGMHTLTASTNVPAGYNLAMSTVVAPTMLAATSGTLGAPVALANNTWGYALANVSSSTSSNTVINGFDAGYVTPTPSVTSKWADPGTMTTIKNTTNSTTVLASSATTDIYYGAKADLTADAGDYAAGVKYTATANLTTIPAPTIASITPNSGSTLGGTTIAIVGAGFTVNGQSVVTGVTMGIAGACTNVSISSDTPSTGQDTIYCNVPMRPNSGGISFNVVVTTWKDAVTVTGGYTYTAPNVTSIYPANGQTFDSGTTQITVTATSDAVAVCSVIGIGFSDAVMETTDGINHSKVVSVSSGNSYYAGVTCRAASGHSIGSGYGSNFYVRSVTPNTPTIVAPAAGQIFAAGTTSVTLSVTTNVAATCSYQVPGDSVATDMATTGGTNHSQSITGLTNNSTNTRNVWCRAGSGSTISNSSGTVSVTFYVQAAAPAAPSLSPSGEASPGNRTVSVTRSGATCTWGTSAGSYPYASGTIQTVVYGGNTLYYSCVAGSGNTLSVATTGSWTFVGISLDPWDETRIGNDPEYFTVNVTMTGYTCYWGFSAGSYPYASGTQSVDIWDQMTVDMYYQCGPYTGSWSATGYYR